MSEFVESPMDVPAWSTHPFSLSLKSESFTFKGILNHYRPPPATIFDPMSGTRRFYELLDGTGTLDGRQYDFVWGDLRPIPGATYRGSMTQPPLRDGIADIGVYDPPFTDSSVISRNQEIHGADHLQRYVGTNDLAQLHSFHALANLTFERVIRRGGLLVIKLYDRHEDRVLHLEHSCVLQFFPRFVLRDMIIYRVRKPLGIKLPYFGKFHAYFLVLERL